MKAPFFKVVLISMFADVVIAISLLNSVLKFGWSFIHKLFNAEISKLQS